MQTFDKVREERIMKKKMRVLSLFLLIAMLFVGCGNKTTENEIPENEAVGNESVENETVVADAFEGKYVVTAEYVKEHMNDENVLIIDCRGTKDAKKGTPEGAIAVTWKELCTCDKSFGKEGDEGWGKIPEASDLEERLAKLGITKDKELIMVGETTGGWGDDARVLWELVAAGYENVKIVDGGLTALKDADIPMQKGASEAEAGEVDIESIDMTHVMETEELAANYDEYVILDVRTEKEYNGATKFGEAKGGHLPGAIYFPYLDLFEKDDTLKTNDEIIAMLEDAGVSKDDKIVAYCTGGIRSAYVQIVLEMCGYENTWNYDQSYWRWCVVNDVEK